MATRQLPRLAGSVVIAKPALQRVIDNLRAAGFTVVGPTLRDSALALEELQQVEQLPIGWTSVHSPGRCRVEPNSETTWFGITVGAQHWKRYLQPARVRLFRCERSNGNGVPTRIEETATPAGPVAIGAGRDLAPPAPSSGPAFEVHAKPEETPRYALLGVRPCDLAAIAILDQVFLRGEFCDPHYSARRSRAFILAANCTEPAATCFCTSLKTGPRAALGYDLALTELSNAFLISIGSELGSEVMEDTGWEPARAFDLNEANDLLQRAERSIERAVKTDHLAAAIYENLEHAHWEKIGERCLSCGNCTLVCPTCFCSTVEDSCDLTGASAERCRVWDSCFVLDFSHVHGGNIRPTIHARYRQWLTHKFASWVEQFGMTGCVGCGRCITWCPVGIDITEELKVFGERASR